MENESSQTLDVSIDDDGRRSVERMARCTVSELAEMIMKESWPGIEAAEMGGWQARYERERALW